MKKQLTLTAVAAVIIAGAAAPYASAATHPAQQTSVVSHLRTAASFDFAAGEAPENITVNPDGSLTLSMLGVPVGKQPELVRIASSGHRTVLTRGQAGDAFTGNTRDREGNVYYNVLSANASRSGVWKLPPGGTPHRIAALPSDGFPNGLAIDPSGRTLYVADSTKGTIWRVPTAGGTATHWLTDTAFAPDRSASLPLGANGLRFHDGAVWVSNTNKGLLLRVQVTTDGTAGRIRTVTSGVVGIDDFNFLTARSNVVFAALNGPNQIAVVYPNGSKKIVLTSADGLDSPTATAVRGKQLYITDGGLAAPHDVKLQQGKISTSALLGSAVS